MTISRPFVDQTFVQNMLPGLGRRYVFARRQAVEMIFLRLLRALLGLTVGRYYLP
jgi:hypothetical protein